MEIFKRICLILLVQITVCLEQDSVSKKDPNNGTISGKFIADKQIAFSANSSLGSVHPVYLDCRSELLPGQFLCTDKNIDPQTQQPRGCQRETSRALQPCEAVPGVICRETGNATFQRDIPCKWTNGYDFETALLLSVFFGFFGIDRFYLGYPAIGLLKFSTLGFFFLGHLLDVILIASQVVGPADGSHYVISYFGPGITRKEMSEETFRKLQPDWF